jgi:diguanylate cyclase (GGDEF)-like protein/PAS domain S-box-containing protein
LSAISRLAIGLMLLSVSMMLIAVLLGLLPDERKSILKGRAALCEAIAINVSYLASSGKTTAVQTVLETVVQRNPDIMSAGLRRGDGRLSVEVGDHASQWTNNSESSTDTQIVVPVMAGKQKWSSVELRFRPLGPGGLRGVLEHPLVRLFSFLAPASLLCFAIYLRRMLRYLDPSKVVPNRVRTTLDTLAEGLLVLDKDERIVHANQAFLDTVGASAAALTGRRASDLSWEKQDDAESDLPWTAALRSGSRTMGKMLALTGNRSKRTFHVNSSPILDDNGEYRGALASFDDVTVIQQKQEELREMLSRLEESRKEIHEQNQLLTVLATLDPLTSCLNRRSFFERFDDFWRTARQENQPFCCVMLDIDHFKLINDTHGHSVGDEVLREVGTVLCAASRENDLVCRFGGEEFCIVLSGMDIELGARVAERYRLAVGKIELPGGTISASLGISSSCFQPKDPQQLIDQSDKSLYQAKRSGRNRVVRWDELSERAKQGLDDDALVPLQSRSLIRKPHRSPVAGGPSQAVDHDVAAIPLQAVNALVSALSYRDCGTAEHSRRVADLCVVLAGGLLSVHDTVTLETAALLHDIGKIGVPDAVLLKPGPLTDEEWKIMGVHDRIGTDMIESTFCHRPLVEIVRTHHSWYGGNPRNPDLPTGTDIPLGARILSICDAYDAMVSDRVYRKGMSQQEAFAELRRCAVRQFDPELVERFIELMEARNLEDSQHVSQSALLNLGMQIERLAVALDRQDVSSLVALASRLNQTAQQHGVPDIADAAQQLQQAAATDCDMQTLVSLTGELLELCRGLHSASQVAV